MAPWRSNAATPGHGSKKNRLGKAFSGSRGLYFGQLLISRRRGGAGTNQEKVTVRRNEAGMNQESRKAGKQAATDCEANGRSLQSRKRRATVSLLASAARAAAGWKFALP